MQAQAIPDFAILYVAAAIFVAVAIAVQSDLGSPPSISLEVLALAAAVWQVGLCLPAVDC